MWEPGYLLGLLGLVLLLVSNWARGQARRRRSQPSRALSRLKSWGSMAAFGCLLAALLMIMGKK